MKNFVLGDWNTPTMSRIELLDSLRADAGTPARDGEQPPDAEPLADREQVTMAMTTNGDERGRVAFVALQSAPTLADAAFEGGA